MANNSTTGMKTWMLGVLSFFMLAFALLSAFPTSSLSKSVSALEGFDDFAAQIMEMQTLYASEEIVLSDEDYAQEGDDVLVSEAVMTSLSLSGDNVGDGLYSIAYSTTDEGEVTTYTSSMRLIVMTDENVDDYGAVMSAKYGDWNVFQYDTVESANSAYEAFKDAGISVCYDEIFSVDYTVEEDEDSSSSSTTSSDSPVSATSSTNPWGSDKTFYSWGASYVGYSDFVANIYTRHADDDDLDDVDTVYVAVLDSGIYREHDFFDSSDGTDMGRLYLDKATSYVTSDSVTYDYEDKNGHGTHVSGTIAESTLDTVKIIPIKILNSKGSGSTNSILLALKYIAGLRDDGLNIRVANMSVGIDLSEETDSTKQASAYVQQYVELAYDSGIACVVSAGNEQTNTQYSSPANVECAITVSGIEESTNTTNSIGVTFATWYSNYGSHVDFCAPGSYVESAYIDSSGKGKTDTTKKLSGTSMAAPHVTAAVALLFCEPYYADYSVDDVVALLSDYAYDLGDEGWDEYYGYGMVYLSDIGVTYETGYVSFTDADTGEAVTSGTFDSGTTLNVALSYTPATTYALCTIYYTTDDNASASYKDWNTYTSGTYVEISATCTLKAVAEVGYEDGSVKRTHVANRDFIFGSVDLLSNYTFTKLSDGTYEITLYSGSLTELELPETYNGTAISTLGDYFLKGTSVTSVKVPDSITTLDTNAFRANTTLKSIVFFTATSQTTATSLTIGNYAFYNCKNLVTLDFNGQDKVIDTIGIYAFAYVSYAVSDSESGLRELCLYDVTTIGNYAFSNCMVETLWLGSSLTSIGTHVAVNHLSDVYGYSDNETATTFASTWGATFHDLLITFNVDLPTFMVIKDGSDFTISVTFSGYGSSFYKFYSETNFMYLSYTVSETTDNGDGTYTNSLTIYSASIANPFSSSVDLNFYATVTDYMGNLWYSTVMTLTIAKNTYTLATASTSDENYTISINGNVVTGDVTLASGVSYDVVVSAVNGYKLKYVYLDDVDQLNAGTDDVITDFSLSITPTYDMTLSVTAAPKETLTITFDTTYDGEERATIYVNGEALSETTYEIGRGENLTFTIVSDNGFTVTLVTANDESADGTSFVDNGDGSYTLVAVTEDILINITYDVKTNSVSLVYGKDCGTVDWTGSSELVVGQSKTYVVTASDGYALDTVTVNSELVEVTTLSSGVYSFTITNDGATDEDLVVEISFKKDTSLGSILTYFIIFSALFGVFVCASVILWIVRRTQDRKKKIA